MLTYQATMQDLPELAVLFDQYRQFYGQSADLEGALQFLKERFIHRQSVIIVVAKSNGQLIGFTQLYPTFSSISMQRSWILNDLYVSEAFRSVGAGQLLLDAAKQYGEQTEAKGIELSTAIDNKAAQRLYERNGYEKDEAYFHYYRKL
ncbi:GNAT family N-acetyltransferase [Paenibacillus sp. DLE-14]|uniref:GNAT family N-acetyltransferase n=1 Tax=Paenibacillus lignilyticus TaxID=1172615 RepID=A0ABS5CDQ3_9BACL|nr:GNAT family N-acetyltransferase [Paenibacillus lignilyticus]